MSTPTRFGRYEVVEPLGQGAMGAVFKARDPAIDRLVAVKTLGGTLLAFPEHREEFLARFRQEARAAGRLSHPAIVAIHDVGVEESTSTPFIVMEYVPGVSLATVLQENPVLPADQALDIVEQVGAALEEAHAHGIVHRDVKPGNIFLDTRGRVKVGDFGIARMEGSELTQTGIGLGTPGYVAPEVLRGARADARSDLFALAVVAYTLLAGRKPFAGKTGQEMGVQVLEHDPPPPKVLRPEVPEAVSAAVMRALVKDADRRTRDVARFLSELRAARGATATAIRPGETPTASATAVPLAPLRPERGGRRAAIVAAALAALALLLAGALLALRYWNGGSEAAPTPTTRPATTRPLVRPTAPAPRPTGQESEERAIRGRDDDQEREDERKKDGGHGKGKARGKKKGH
jgi:serine/threonine-protein kinase